MLVIGVPLRWQRGVAADAQGTARMTWNFGDMRLMR